MWSTNLVVGNIEWNVVVLDLWLEQEQKLLVELGGWVQMHWTKGHHPICHQQLDKVVGLKLLR